MKVKISLLTIMAISSLMMNAQTIMNIHQNDGTVLQIPLNTIDSITYTIINPGNLATLTTLPIGNITDISASTGGNITNDGGTPITQRGVVWGTSPSPTTANNSTTNSSGTGSFTSNLTGLTSNTTYYVRAYATNSAGTAYGNELSFTTTAGGGGIVTNPGAGVTFDGYTYASIVLGNGQEWMAENLRTTTYANGDPIPNVTDGAQWNDLNTGAWAYYDNNIQYDNPYGKLYNWYTVPDPRNLCPTGWHVPTDAEWTVLTDYLGGEPVAGGKMKSTGTQHWLFPNIDATNESGFSGLPGGVRYYLDGSFSNINYKGFWWSSTEVFGSPWLRTLDYENGNANRQQNYKKYGFSVRCLKGNLATITTVPIANITGISAITGGNITNDGGTPVTQRGVVWGTSPNPTIANNSTTDGSGVGTFTSNLTGLTATTTYYVRAYATTGTGTVYGNEISFTTTAGEGGNGIFTSGNGVTFDGYTYASIVLGNGQEWMAENLRTTTYANGDPIPNVTDNTQWLYLTTGAWSHYNNESQYENPYGKLYNWYTVDDPRNVCPTGWHVPSDSEWTVLTDYLGGESIAGGKMKSTGTQHWNNPNTNATNASGFSGFPGGHRSGNGQFGWLGSRGDYWSSTEYDTLTAWYRELITDGADVSRLNHTKPKGHSVRCIKD